LDPPLSGRKAIVANDNYVSVAANDNSVVAGEAIAA
jgi:hypothetical protein